MFSILLTFTSHHIQHVTVRSLFQESSELMRFSKNKKDLAFDLGMDGLVSNEVLHDKLRGVAADLTHVQQVTCFYAFKRSIKFWSPGSTDCWKNLKEG